jgi:hypothetical protein
MRLRETANSIGTTFGIVSLVGAGFGWALGGSDFQHLLDGAASAALFAGLPLATAQAGIWLVRWVRRPLLPGLPVVVEDSHRVH